MSEPPRNRLSPRAIRPPSPESLERHQATQAAQPAAPAQRSQPLGLYGMSPQDELDYFAREVNLAEFLEARGYRVGETWTTGCRLIRGGSHPRHPKDAHRGADEIAVKYPAPGEPWYWTRPDKSQSGSVIAYLQKVEGIASLGDVRKVLRRYLTGQEMPGATYRSAPPPTAPYQLPPSPAPRSTADPQVLPEPTEASAPRSTPHQRWNWMKEDERKQAVREAMVNGVNRYLVEQRGLHVALLRRFVTEMATEGPRSSQNPLGACFAHRDGQGQLTGYERKGPKHREDDVRSFSHFSGGGQRRITRMGNTTGPERIIVGESAVEVLSVAQVDLVEGRSIDGALLCSTYGTPSTEGLADLAELARRHPDAVFELAFNNDGPGADFANRVREAVLEANPGAVITDRSPPSAYKDWNDVVRGKPRVPVEPRGEEPFVYR